MKKVSAFMSMSTLNNNTPGITAVIGELSRISETFAKEVGLYGKAQYPDVRLHAFDSRSGETKIAIEPGYSNAILALGQWMYAKSIGSHFNSNRDNCQQMINADFSNIIEISAIGQMVTNGNYWLPEYLFFKVLGQSDDNMIRVWFSDAAFQAQYDLYEVIVVPPVEKIDDLLKDRLSVRNLLNTITVTKVLERAAELTVGYPETYLPSKDYDWVDRNDPTVRYPTPWATAIYGNAGNNPDVIREALIDYILGNSAFGRDVWELVYPDIFRPTEFYIAPIWDRYSLPNQVQTAGLFSPSIPYRHIMDYAKQMVHDATPEYLAENLTCLSLKFKGLMFLAVGNPRNRGEKFQFDALWPNYINLSTLDADFDRIPPATQKFILFLVNLVRVAETTNEYSKLPVGVSRVERGGVDYIAASHLDVLYLVALAGNKLTIPLPDETQPDPGRPQ